jgi:hypothetical protein
VLSVVVIPVVAALLLAALLEPAAAVLRDRGTHRSLAAVIVLITGLVVVGGLVAVPLLTVGNTAVRYLAGHPGGEPTPDREPPGTESTDPGEAAAEDADDDASERADPRRRRPRTPRSAPGRHRRHTPVHDGNGVDPTPRGIPAHHD